jgi:hypothetical protein
MLACYLTLISKLLNTFKQVFSYIFFFSLQLATKLVVKKIPAFPSYFKTLMTFLYNILTPYFQISSFHESFLKIDIDTKG